MASARSRILEGLEIRDEGPGRQPASEMASDACGGQAVVAMAA
jgi:hypothetical protein